MQPSKNPTTWATDSPVPIGWMRQFKYFLQLYNIYKNIEGDIVECGIGEGNTFAMLAYLIGEEKVNKSSNRILWGFDSFEGWPKPTEWDISPRNPQKGEWAISDEIVKNALKKTGIYQEFPDLDIRIIKGFFNKTLPLFPNRPIAFLHIDADLHTGYHDTLVNLFPKVAKGGVIAFDEYKRFPNRPEYNYGSIEKWPGCTKAVDDYFSDKLHQQIKYVEYSKEEDKIQKKYYIIKS